MSDQRANMSTQGLNSDDHNYPSEGQQPEPTQVVRHRHVHRDSQQSKHKSVRQQRFENENPDITKGETRTPLKNSSTFNKSSGKPKTSIDPEPVKWQPPAVLVPHPNGQKGIRLLDQCPELVRVGQRAIDLTEAKTIFVHGYPDPGTLPAETRKVILRSARTLCREFPADGYDIIKKRIQHPDHNFTDALGKLVIERITNARGDAKKAAELCIMGYELTGDAELCKKRVEVLLKDDNFAYPGKWESSSSVQVRKVDELAPYMSMPIIACMKRLCTKYKADQYPEFFRSTIDDLPNEQELPPGLVAMATTAIFAVLRDWASGTHRPTKFESNIYSTAYDSNMQWLTGARNRNPLNYHRLMHKLFQLVREEEVQHRAEKVNKIPVDLIDRIAF